MHQPEENEEIITAGMRITGVRIAYYFICHTKLWLFSHHITLENEHENVKIGRTLHEDRYSRDKKDITIDQTISVDFVRKGESLVLHEIKKTRKMDEAHRWQMLYYLYYLRSRGVEAAGEINYPLLSKKEQVTFTEKDESDMERIIDDIRRIISGKMPSPRKIKICTKCAYFEFCFGDEL